VTDFYQLLGVARDASDADIKKAIKFAISGMNFSWCGQSCGSMSRLMVHESVYDEPWRGRLARKEITEVQATEAASMYLNVVLEHRFVLAAVKAAP